MRRDYIAERKNLNLHELQIFRALIAERNQNIVERDREKNRRFIEIFFYLVSIAIFLVFLKHTSITAQISIVTVLMVFSKFINIILLYLIRIFARIIY
jgi:hypothetical protein